MCQMTRYMLALHARRSALMVLCVALLATLSACSSHKHPDPIEMVPSNMCQMTRYMLALHARRSALMVLCVALLATLSACSSHKHPDPIEMVPSTAVVVKTIDLRALLREAGSPVAVKGDSLTVEADKVVSLMVNPDFREPLAALLAAGEAVDFSRMTAFTTSRGCDVVLLPVLDEDMCQMTRYMLALHARRSALMVLCVALLATLSACSSHKHPDPIEMVPSSPCSTKICSKRPSRPMVRDLKRAKD